MLDLSRFKNHYAVDFVDINNHKTIRNFDFSQNDVEKGVLKDVLEENIVEVVTPNSIIETEYNAVCHVYVNGLLVYNIEKELGISSSLDSNLNKSFSKMLRLERQKSILSMIDIYNNTDSKIIKNNISKFIKHKNSGYYSKDIAKMLGVSFHTIREWCKVSAPNKPYFESALKLADILGIDVLDFTKKNNQA